MIANEVYNYIMKGEHYLSLSLGEGYFLHVFLRKTCVTQDGRQNIFALLWRSHNVQNL